MIAVRYAVPSAPRLRPSRRASAMAAAARSPARPRSTRRFGAATATRRRGGRVIDEQIAAGLPRRRVGRSRSCSRAISAASAAPRMSIGGGCVTIGATGARLPTSPRRRATRRARRRPTTNVAVRFRFIAMTPTDRSTRTFAVVLLFVVHPASTGSAVDSVPPLNIVAVIPARFASTRLPGKAARRHRRPADDRARVPARRGVAGRRRRSSSRPTICASRRA